MLGAGAVGSARCRQMTPEVRERTPGLPDASGPGRERDPGPCARVKKFETPYTGRPGGLKVGRTGRAGRFGGLGTRKMPGAVGGGTSCRAPLRNHRGKLKTPILRYVRFG